MITFSTDIGQEIVDWENCAEMAERYFQTRSDKTQMQITKENAEWLQMHFPTSLNIIKNDNRVIGFSFILLSDDDIMNKFITKKNNEQDIFDAFQKQYKNIRMNNVYLCASVVLESYRNKGLATLGFMKQILLLEDIHHLYSWPFSAGGKRLSEKISSELSIPLLMRMK